MNLNFEISTCDPLISTGFIVSIQLKDSFTYKGLTFSVLSFKLNLGNMLIQVNVLGISAQL